ncbi:MAG: hypothetical protein VYC34_06110, partial [Planctomycetota bacterium]|nr:hypothetical protein [Planctomycetota bacterium]
QSDQSSIELRVRNIAQQSLDDLGAGIAISRVTLFDKVPPYRVDAAFKHVTSAESRAQQRVVEAEKTAREILNNAAGEAFPVLLSLIDEYENALELEENDRAEELLAQIDEVIEGREIAHEGRAVSAAGEVASIISAARQYRTDVVASARTRATEFNVKLANYRASPRYFVASEWRPAYEAFRDSGAVEVLLVPSGSNMDVWLNRDPDIADEMERARNRAEAEAAVEQRNEEQERAWRERDRQKREERRREGN